MIIVSGGFGFIGSNLIRLLNDAGFDKIIVVDDLTDGKKALNLANARIYDFIDSYAFENLMDEKGALDSLEITHFFHLGAISATNEWNGTLVMNRNFEYSKKVLKYCVSRSINLTYASSASVYGRSHGPSCEDLSPISPQNVYAYSKALFDNYVFGFNRTYNINIVGLRYFNVFGPGEAHKIGMTSPVYMFHNQVMTKGKCSVFGAALGYEGGAHSRDFIHVEDACKITKFFMDQNVSGIFNVGTGVTTSFGDVAKFIVNYHGADVDVDIEFVDFPDSLKKYYQPYTCSNTDKLRKAGYVDDFIRIEDGITSYIETLNHQNSLER